MTLRSRLTLPILTLLTAVALAMPASAQELQTIFDDTLGEGCVDTGLETGQQSFAGGSYQFRLLARYKGLGNVFGWQEVGKSADFHLIFDGDDVPGDVATATIPVPFKLVLVTTYTWSSQNSDNFDGYDHFHTYQMCGPPGGIAAGIEDVEYGGDLDHNDFVFAMQEANDYPITLTYAIKEEESTLDEGGRPSLLGPGAARGIQGSLEDFFPEPGPSLQSEEDIDIEVVSNPDGCGEPIVTRNGLDFTIDWGLPCFDLNESVGLCIRTDKGAVTIAEASLFDAGGSAIEGAKPKAEESAPVPSCTTEEQQIDCSQAFAVVGRIWPPNHKFVPVTIAGVQSPGGGEVTITATAVTQDEPVNAQGDGNTCPDAVINDGVAQVMAERAGGGNGRVYTISFTASDGTNSCNGSVTVCVPHHAEAPGCVDDGQSYNSLAGCDDLIGRKHRSRPGITVANPEAGPSSAGTVEFTVPQAADVSLGVYDLAGRRLVTLARGMRDAGSHKVAWNNAGLPSGLYFYRLSVGGEVVSRSFLIVR